MNCEQFKQIIGMRCNAIDSAVEIVTPFTFSDGNAIELFAQSYGSLIHFFDDGFTLLHLHSAGVRFGNNKRRWQPLKAIAQVHGVTLSDDGVFETICPADSAGQGFARMVATLMGIAAWERDQAGVAMDSSWLVDEVAIYLRAWKPQASLIEKPIIKGFSGRPLTFDFDFDGQYIDRVNPSIAKQEIDILGRVAKTWPISALIFASGAAQALQ